MISFDCLGKLVRSLAQLVPGRSPHARVELKTFRTTGFREKRFATEPFTHPLSNTTTFGDRRPGTGVEVQDHVIRRRGFGFSFRDVPERYVKFDGGKIGGPQQAGPITHRGVHDGLVLPSFGRNFNRLDPIRLMLGRVLLVERHPFDSVGIATKRRGAVNEVRHHDVGDPGVVIEHLALRESGIGVQDLVEVRQRQFTAVDCRKDSLRTHGPLLSRPYPFAVHATMVDAGGRRWSTPRTGPRQRSLGERSARAPSLHG